MSKDRKDTDLSARTGQTPAEISATQRMEEGYFPGESAESLTEDEFDDLISMVEDYMIQQEALIRTLERKGIVSQRDVEQAIEEIISEDSEEEPF